VSIFVVFLLVLGISAWLDEARRDGEARGRTQARRDDDDYDTHHTDPGLGRDFDDD